MMGYLRRRMDGRVVSALGAILGVVVLTVVILGILGGRGDTSARDASTQAVPTAIESTAADADPAAMAQRLLEAGEFRQAAVLAENAVNRAPESPDAWQVFVRASLALAAQHEVEGGYAEAQQAYEHASAAIRRWRSLLVSGQHVTQTDVARLVSHQQTVQQEQDAFAERLIAAARKLYETGKHPKWWWAVSRHAVPKSLEPNGLEAFFGVYKELEGNGWEWGDDEDMFIAALALLDVLDVQALSPSVRQKKVEMWIKCNAELGTRDRERYKLRTALANGMGSADSR